MTEENKVIVRRLYEIISTGDFGRAGRSWTATPRTTRSFPAIRLPGSLRPVAEGDRMAARVTMRGSRRGELQGVAPTGKRVEVKAIDMFRISDGRIVEHWGRSDDPSGFLRATVPLNFRKSRNAGLDAGHRVRNRASCRSGEPVSRDRRWA